MNHYEKMILTLIFLGVALWRTYRTAKINKHDAIFWTGMAAVVFIVSQVLSEALVMLVCYLGFWGLSMQSFVKNFTIIKLVSLIFSFVLLWLTVGWRISLMRTPEEIQLPPSPPNFNQPN